MRCANSWRLEQVALVLESWRFILEGLVAASEPRKRDTSDKEIMRRVDFATCATSATSSSVAPKATDLGPGTRC